MTTTFDVASQNNLGVLNGTSSYPSISADGNLVAFFSFNPVTMLDQVFTKNESTSALTLLSQSSSGATGNANSIDPAISADGTSVTFSSTATNLVAGATAGNSEVYVKNPATGGLQLASQTQNGIVANGTNEFPAISSNGGIVVFDSNASNLGLGATGAVNEIYVKNLTTGFLQLASQTASGTISNGTGFADSITPDGNLVLFESTATDLGSTNGFSQIYVKNVATGALTLASETSAGVIGNGSSRDGSISSDGLTAVFDSNATNLVPGATSGATEVYEKNLATGAMTLVSQKADGTIANGVSSHPVASVDGKYVIFESTATNLDPAATSGTQQVYVKNLETGALTLLSKDSSGIAGNNASFTPFGNAQAFSADGSLTTFATDATNLAGTAAGTEVILRARTTGPALTEGAVAGDDIVSPGELSAATFTGTSDAIGGTVQVAIDTAANTIGTATVQANGTWSLTANVATLAQGSHTEIATVSGTASYLSTTGSHAFAVNGPALTFNPVAGDDVVTGSETATASFSGTSDAIGATVSVALDTAGNVIGTTTVQANGTWSLTANLGAAAQGAHTEITTVQLTPTLTTTGTHAFTINTAGPTTTFDTGVHFTSATKALLTGTVSDAAGVKSLEIFDGTKDLGAATVKADGTWKLAATLAAGTHDQLSAVATDAFGNTSSTAASFSLQTGIKGAPYTSYEADLDAQGNLTGETYTNRKGAVYLADLVTNLADGDHEIDNYAGTYFKGQAFSYQSDVYSSDYSTLKLDTLYNNDGTHTITGGADKLTIQSLSDDTMTGGGSKETFKFDAHAGQEIITDFQAKGSGHDVISLAHSSVASIAQALHDAHGQGQDTVIKLGSQLTITLQDVAVSSLSQSDFKLHA